MARAAVHTPIGLLRKRAAILADELTRIFLLELLLVDA